MAGSLMFGFSATPAGTGEPEDSPAFESIHTLTLTSGVKAADQTTSIPASTSVSSPTRLWTAANHGVSATAASLDALVVAVDPAKTATDNLSAKVRAVYTRTASTSTVNTVFSLLTRNHAPLVIPGTAEDATGVMYLTAIDGANANSEALNVRTTGWK